MKLSLNNFTITGTQILKILTSISLISTSYLCYMKYINNIATETVVFSILISLLSLYLLKRR